MNKFIFSILFLFCIIAEDVQGQNIPDESWRNYFPNKINVVPDTVQIKCHKCDHMNKEGKCLHGEGVCFLKSPEVCMTKKVYEGGRLLYIVQGCEAFCWATSLSIDNHEIQFECCQDKPLCNVP